MEKLFGRILVKIHPYHDPPETIVPHDLGAFKGARARYNSR